MRLKSQNWLFIILFIFFVKGLVLIFLIPAWEAPDEPGHVAYVQYLYTQKKLPSIKKPFISKSINNSLMKSRQNLTLIRKNKMKWQLPQNLFNRKSTDYDKTANLAGHPPLHYLYLIPFYNTSLSLSSYGTLILLRLGSLLLGLGSLFLIFHITLRFFNKSKILPLLVTFLVSFQPMFSFISSIVNNDSMVVFIFLLYVLLAIDFSNKKHISFKDVMLITFIAGVSPLVKPQLSILILVNILFLLMKYKKGIIISLLLSVTTAFPFIFWTIYQFVQEGVDFASYSVQNIRSIPSPIWQYPIDFIFGKQPIGIFMSFIGFFGWLDIPFPKLMYLFYVFLIVIALIGWLLKLKENNYKMIFSKENGLVFISVVFLLYCFTIMLFDIQTYILGHHFTIQGRYLAPILPLLILFLVKGSTFFKMKTQKILLFLSMFIFICGQLIMYLVIFRHYYGIIPFILF